MKYFILIGLLLVTASILFVGLKVNKTLMDSADWKIRNAYLKGIASQPMPNPATLNKGHEYIVRTYFSSSDCVVSNIYPGIEN